ncbi:MAG: helix-turn-helix transcriptional regulator [Sphingopyxis sp.]|nr:helix-turn-helix transcriptional regulator [Sphingopyxis sp.]
MFDKTEDRPASSRLLLDQIADKWSILVLGALCTGPLRFNALKRSLDGVTQASLTQTLRRLERNGIVERMVISTSPIAVEYVITPLGRSLEPLFHSIDDWTRTSLPEVEAARRRFDERRRT